MRLFILLILSAGTVQAQWTESFADGDFTNGIVWNGSTDAWQVVGGSDVAAGAAGSNTIRLAAASGSGTKYLSTQLPGSWGSEQSWSFWMGRRGQAATSSNISYVWLYASEEDIGSATVNGYRLRFGDDVSTGDKLILEYITNGVPSSIASSANASANGITDFGFLVRVTRDASGQWNLYTSELPQASGTGAVATEMPNALNTPVLQVSVQHNLIPVLDNGFMVLAARHTTGTAARAGAEFDQLSMHHVAGSPLPVKFSALRAEADFSGVAVHWENSSESNLDHYYIERALSGGQFIEQARIQPLGNEGHSVRYSFIDPDTRPGTRLYRIKAVETDGTITYSRIIRVNLSSDTIRIEPNPFRDHCSLLVPGMSAGNYTVYLYNSMGKPVYRLSFYHPGGNCRKQLVPDMLPPGMYWLDLQGPDRVHQKILKQ